jgi:hypothetical protein
MKNLEQLNERIEGLREAIKVTSETLNSKEYSEQYQFKFINPITVDTFSNPTLKVIVDTLKKRNIGFDPSLAMQHIEKEALEQFNEIFTQHIRGMGLENLMAMNFELEKFEMKSRIEHHDKQLKELLELQNNVIEQSNTKKKK